MPKKSPAAQLRDAWTTLRPLPLGRWMFSRLFGWLVPYTGSIGATVEELEPGYARMTLRDRRAVRNHLNSVHAIALANLGEACSGLAMIGGLPDDVRGIVTNFSVEYLKKARGTLTATCRTEVPRVTQDQDYQAIAVITDATGEVVARATAVWRLGPDPKKAVPAEVA